MELDTILFVRLPAALGQRRERFPSKMLFLAASFEHAGLPVEWLDLSHQRWPVMEELRAVSTVVFEIETLAQSSCLRGALQRLEWPRVARRIACFGIAATEVCHQLSRSNWRVENWGVAELASLMQAQVLTRSPLPSEASLLAIFTRLPAALQSAYLACVIPLQLQRSITALRSDLWLLASTAIHRGCMLLQLLLEPDDLFDCPEHALLVLKEFVLLQQAMPLTIELHGSYQLPSILAAIERLPELPHLLDITGLRFVS